MSKKPKVSYKDKDKARHISYDNLPYPKDKLNANNLLIRMTARILQEYGVTTQEVRGVLKEWYETLEEVTRLKNGYQVAFPYVGRFEPVPYKSDLAYLRAMPAWMRHTFKIQKVNAVEWLEILSDPMRAAEYQNFLATKRCRLMVYDIVNISRNGITAAESIDLASRVKQALVDDDPGIQDFDNEGQGLEG